jgi:uncharacterized membrane protein YbaN (DUF454 family)
MRYAYLGLGFLFLGLAGIGTVVPGLPVTIFCILALWAFKKSSPKMEAWLLNHKVVGPTLRDWEENRSITRRTKMVAITMIWVMIAISAIMILSRKPTPVHLAGLELTRQGLLAGLLGVVAVSLTVYLATRTTKVA